LETIGDDIPNDENDTSIDDEGKGKKLIQFLISRHFLSVVTSGNINNPGQGALLGSRQWTRTKM
jgi:hypothetical protein